MNTATELVRHKRFPAILLLLFGMVVLCAVLAFGGAWIYFQFFFSFEGPPRVQEIALGDLNGDGYLDAYLSITPDGEPYSYPDNLLFNDGQGRFKDSGIDFGDSSTFSVELGDVNGDGLLDIVVGWLGVKVYRNYGSGTFHGHYSVGGMQDGVYSIHVALTDLNNDGGLDIFGAGCCGGGISGNGGVQQVLFPTSLVWLGNGQGAFTGTGQSLGQVGSQTVAIADLNGDGAPDAFLANSSVMDASGNLQRGAPNTVWFNDWQGFFTDSGQQLGRAESYAVLLGDVNGDGFIVAVVGNRGQDEVWFNDGQGNFTDSGQQLGSGLTYSVFLADLDDDGDLDLVTGGETSAQVWFNDGAGTFSQGQEIAYKKYEAIALGEVTGDGILDIFVGGAESYQVWHGEGDGSFTAAPHTIFTTPYP